MGTDAKHDQRAEQKQQALFEVAQLALRAQHGILECQLYLTFLVFLAAGFALTALVGGAVLIAAFSAFTWARGFLVSVLFSALVVATVFSSAMVAAVVAARASALIFASALRTAFFPSVAGAPSAPAGNSTLPPAASTAARAPFDTSKPCNTTLRFSSPETITLADSAWMDTTPAALSTRISMVSPPILFRSDSRTSAVSCLSGETKPRFGKRRCNGIWPPSKPTL